MGFAFVVFGAFFASLGIVSALDPPPLIMPGQLSIGVFTNLRNSVTRDVEGQGNDCEGPVALWALQEVASLEWALMTLNNQSQNQFSIGLKVYDSCGNTDRILRQASALIRDNDEQNSPLLGIITLGFGPEAEAAVPFLHAFGVPVLMTHLSPSEEPRPDNVFTTAPHLYAQTQAVLSVLSRQRRFRSSAFLEGEDRLGVITGCQRCLDILERIAKRSGVVITSKLTIDVKKDRMKLAEKSLEFIKSQVGFRGTVVVILEADVLNSLASEMFGDLLKRSHTRWIFSVIDGEVSAGQIDTKKLYEVFPGAVLVEPHSQLLPGLDHHLDEVVYGNQSIVSTLLPLLQDDAEPCSPDEFVDESGMLCSPLRNLKGNQKISGARATASVKAISSLAAAFKLVQIDVCSESKNCQKVISNDIGKKVLGALVKLSYTPEWIWDNIRYTADGRLINTFTIFKVSRHGLQKIGRYREDTGMLWTHPLPGTRRDRHEPLRNQDKNPVSDDVILFQGLPEVDFDEKIRELDLIDPEKRLQENEEGFMKDMLLSYQEYSSWAWAWALTILVCSGVGMLATLGIGGYVSFKYWDGSITGNKFLGTVLLLGLLMVYASCIIYILPPTSTTCKMRVWLPNAALVLCFSVILVKGMHLRAVEAVGVGGMVSQSNLLISMAFMIALEVVITILGNSSSPEDANSLPPVELDGSGMRMCRRARLSSWLSQIYFLILLAIGVIQGFVNRKIQRNHNESFWLWMTSGVCIPVVLVWSLLSNLCSESFETPNTSVACIAIATVILGLVFGPKLKIISNQNDQFSHKRMPVTPTLSTIFPQTNCPRHKVQPPMPFCDANHDDDFNPNDEYGAATNDEPQLFNVSSQITWRDHMQESPCFRKSCRIPPPPPPPYAKYRQF